MKSKLLAALALLAATALMIISLGGMFIPASDSFFHSMLAHFICFISTPLMFLPLSTMMSDKDEEILSLQRTIDNLKYQLDNRTEELRVCKEIHSSDKLDRFIVDAVAETKALNYMGEAEPHTVLNEIKHNET